MVGWLWRVLGRVRTGRDEAPTGAAPAPPAVRPNPIYTAPNEVGVDDAEGGPVFVVRFGEHVTPEPITDDLAQLLIRTRVALAFAATPGTDPMVLVVVDTDNLTGWSEGEFWRYEGRVRPTPANCLALRAVGLPWTATAQRACYPAADTTEDIEEVRREMSRLARLRWER